MNQEDLRRIEVRCYGEDEKLLMTSSYDVDMLRARSEAVSVQVQTDAPREPWSMTDRYALPANRTLSIKMPLSTGEVRMGPAADDTVMCRWDDDSESYVPVFVSRSIGRRVEPSSP